MLHTIALIVVIVSATLPAPTGKSWGCFNARYPAPVIAEDNSTIQCPAVYYGNH